MEKHISYKSTIFACYSGNFAQAVVINLTPIIFIPLREQFGFTYTQFGTLVLINFITQVMADVLCSKAVDKYGFRPFAVWANILCTLGFLMFALTPFFLRGNEYIGFVLSTVVFSAAGGLLELILSPIVGSIPTDEKNKAMTLLHSFYCWGQVTVAVVTTLLIFAFGQKSWMWIVLGWSVVPFINLLLFWGVPIPTTPHISQVMKIRNLIRTPVFILAFFAIMFGAASELAMAQWSSSFMEKGLALPKVMGDIIGMSGFAVMMGLGRIIYGKYAGRFNLSGVMMAGSFVAIICYITVGLSPFKWLSLAACCLTGLCISLLWPGTLLVAAEKLPLAGASMFALLAAGGDVGASIGPWMAGVITDTTVSLVPSGLFGLTAEQFGLRAGILFCCVFPLCSLILHKALSQKSSAEFSIDISESVK